MNLFRNKLNILALWGNILSSLGGVVFAITFWYTGGFYMAGDAFMYGPYINELILFFPLSGIGVLLVFLGRFLSGKLRKITDMKLFLIFLFLAVLVFKSLFVIDAIWQLSMFAVWGIAFFSAVTFDFWYLDETWKKISLFLGLFIGFLADYLKIIEGVSVELLGVVSFLLSISLAFSKSFRGRQLLLFFCSVIIFYSFNILLIGIVLVVFFSQKLWLNRARKISFDLGLIPAGFILLILLFFKYPYMNLKTK